VAAGSIAIEVEVGDALSALADALVLKHAQASFGVDAAVKKRLKLDPEMSLLPGRKLIVDGYPRLGAGKAIFLGTPPLPDFGYSEIRLFARLAVATVRAELPEAREMAITLQGAGFGLDEIACFEAELSGLLDGIGLADGATELERIKVVESDPARAERIGARLAEVLPDGEWEIGAGTGAAVERSGADLRSWVKAPEDRDHAFVAMPVSADLDDRFHYGITTAVHACGLLCERIDEAAFTGDVLEQIEQKIRSATLVVADLSLANPNVYLEVGFAWGIGVPTVLICHADSELQFDVRGQKCLFFSSIHGLEESLTGELAQLVG
jgi:hypothetical protein